MIKLINISKEKIYKYLHSKPIIAFFAGKAFENICRAFDIGKEIIYIVDNKKANQKIAIDNVEIEIKSFDQIGDEINYCIRLITSYRYFDQLVKQLESNKKTDCLEYFMPYALDNFNNIDDEPFIFDNNMPSLIPKTIHYCWFGNNPMPQQYINNIDSWKKYCPDYEIVLWNEKNYDVSKNKYMKQAYEKKKWGFVSDYARIDVVNSCGGIYFDTDVEVVKSFDDLLKFKMFCGFENASLVNTGHGFGAIKNNSILFDLLLLYNELEFINKDGSMNLTPCPVFFTSIIKKCGIIINGKTQIKDEVVVFSPVYFSPLDYFGRGEISDKTFSIHQYAASWFEPEQKLKREEDKKKLKLINDRLTKRDDIK